MGSSSVVDIKLRASTAVPLCGNETSGNPIIGIISKPKAHKGNIPFRIARVHQHNFKKKTAKRTF